MANNPHPQRRDFLKTAAAGAAGAMGISAFKFDKLFAQSTGNVWTSGMQINPAIDNKRVICCYDPTMLAHYPAAGSVIKSDFTSQNSYVDAAKVASNMDEMAMQLAQKTSAADAWSTIFRTGNSGGWGSTRVAIKVNGINGSSPVNRGRVAVVKKICDVLVDQFGVKPANIVVYDACDDASIPYGPYVDANDSTKIRAAPVSVRAAGLGGFKAVTLTSTTGVSCPADLVDGKIDILVDIAVAKMHDGPGGSYGYGSCTLCMKNHLGTFTSGTQAQHSGALHSLKSQIEINQHSAVLGGNPVRQQLCIVDALLSNGASGPGGSADNRTDRLVMGTFAPFVDYFTANYILFDPTNMAASPIPQKGLTAAATLIPQFATGFGYTAPPASPATPDPGWVSYPASSPPPKNSSGTGGTGGGSGGASGSGGISAAGGARSGGTSPAGGARTGGTSASGGASGSGGTSASGGASGSGGTSGSGGASGSGGTSGSGDARTGGTSASGGAASGGTNASGGAASGGTSASGGAASGGTTSGSGGAVGTGGATTSSASGGSATTGGSTSGNRTGGSSGKPGLTAGGNSGGGCDVAGVDRRATRWGAMLAFGAVVAEKLRRLVSGNDQSS
jgi:hypothetical protein